jgi:hypothetical protein
MIRDKSGDTSDRPPFQGGRTGVGRQGHGVCLVASTATEDIWLS